MTIRPQSVLRLRVRGRHLESERDLAFEFTPEDRRLIGAILQAAKDRGRRRQEG